MQDHRTSGLKSLGCLSTSASIGLMVAGFKSCQPGPVDRATCTTAADERPTPPTALRCSRNVSVARPPFDGTRSDTVPFVSLPLAVSFPRKVCLIRLSQVKGSVHNDSGNSCSAQSVERTESKRTCAHSAHVNRLSWAASPLYSGRMSSSLKGPVHGFQSL